MECHSLMIGYTRTSANGFGEELMMATTHSISAADVAKQFSDVIRGEPAAKQVCFRQLGPVSEIWLIVDAPDLEIERRLLSAGLKLYETFPDQLIDFQLVNLAVSAAEINSRVPQDSDSIVLH
jgi:hypothetical protein